MKNNELINLHTNLKTKFNNLQGEKFSYFINKNIKIIESYMISIKTTFQTDNKINEDESGKYNDYMQKANELQMKYSNEQNYKDLAALKSSKEDTNDEADIKTLQSLIENNMKEHEIAFEELNAKFKETVDIIDAQNQAWTSLMNSDSEIILYKIERKNIPNDINPEQEGMIFDLIIDIE